MQAIESALTPMLRKQLFVYSYNLVSGRSWPSESDVSELAQDVVSEAICKTITGDRRWEPKERHDPTVSSLSPTLLTSLKNHLFSSVKSITDAKGKHKENKLLRGPLDERTANHTPDQSATAPCDQMEADEFFYSLMVELDEDAICSRMLSLYEKGLAPSEVRELLRKGSAEQQALTTQDIYASEKRLRRKTRSFLQDLQRQLS